ncbi:MAG TPA: tetratricopeptide repeat protein, partial [Kofleriaceae bacterium]|nr:tetratricopeptide repeat protein [Kofleriaceae bacterium]
MSVHPDHIRGRSAIADDGFEVGPIDTLRIPRNTVSALEAAIASGAPAIAQLATGEPFIDGFLELLGGGAKPALLLPVQIKSRVVAVVAAHCGDAAPNAGDVDALTPLLDASSRALARVLATREKAAGSSVVTKRTESADGYEIEVSMADVGAKRAQLDKFRQAHQWAEVAEGIRELIRDGMANGDPDEDEQLELLLELGKVELDELYNPERALEAWRSAQTIDAGESRLLDAIEELYVREGRWEDCIDLVEKRVALADDDQVRVATLLNLATLAHERIGDDNRAIAAYQKVLEIEPDNDLASRELGKLYTVSEQWQPLADLLLDRASRTADLDPLMLVAHIFEDKLEDAHNAFVVWLTVFRREPERPHLLEQLHRLAPRTSLAELLPETKALAGELEAKYPAIAAELWHAIGNWARDVLDQREEAAAALERAARLDPGKTDEAADLLRNDGKWADLVALLVRRSDHETDAKRRSALFAEVGELYETRLEQPYDAIEWFERATAEDPSSPAPLVALHRIHLDRENWDALGELLPRLIETLGLSAPRALIVDLYVELGTILADQLGRPDDAVESFRDALALDPKHVPAFQGLAKVYQTGGQTEALLEASEAEVDASPAVVQVKRYPDIAAEWHELSRLDRAIATWHKMLALEPRNVDAHKGLARALRDDEQWAELAVALRAQHKVIIEPFERIALLLELADLNENRFTNHEPAISTYREVLAIDPHNRAALDALARLYERAGQWLASLDILQRIAAETVNDRRAHSEVLQRIGQVQLSARDTVKAEASLTEAIALDPDNAHAHEGMGRVLLQQGKLVAAAEKLLRAAQLSQHKGEITRLLTDAAWIFRYRLADNEHARECLERILEIDPEHVDAKQAMAELLHDTQEWASLWEHLEDQAERAQTDEAMPAPERLAIFQKAARCALELRKFAVSIALYDAALAIDQSPQTQLDRAEAFYRSNALDAAAAAYQTILARYQTTLERPQLIEINRKLGAIYAELGKTGQAVTFYQKVLDLDGNHRETHNDLAELHLARGQFDDAIASLRSLAALASGPERVPFLERIGDLYHDKLSSTARAMSTYLEALDADKNNHRILQRILELQTETGQWKPAVETIERFLAVETDAARRGAYHIASAEIRRTHLKDDAGALECYETAIDEMFREEPLREATRERALDAFHALRELVTADKNWKYLEQCYRRMIRRVPKGDPVVLPLWDGLGDIYRFRLQHPQSAIETFEVAHNLDPDKSPHRTRILAELYAQTGTKRPKQASEKAARLVEVDPMNADSYRALGRTALAAGRVDEAWCVARALVFLKQANKEETALYHRYQRHETRKAKGLLDEDAWGHVRHPDEDLTISAIFALTWEASVALRAGPAKAFQLKPKERLGIEESTGIVAKIFK